MLRRLTRVIKNIDALVDRSTDADADLLNLKELWQALNRHRLEMEAAENKPVTAEAVPAVSGIATIVTESRLDRIEKRLDEIGAELKELTRVYVRHITRLHAVAKTVDEREYPMTPEDATESPPSSG
jgi:hypothetical protein